MQYKYILAIDVSKLTIDVAWSHNKANSTMITHQFTNNVKGYQKMLSWLKEQKAVLEEHLICLENTGNYHRCLVAFLQSKQAFVWVENPLTIKWSGGLQRGKSDKVDAQPINVYAYRNQDKADNFSAKHKFLEQIAELKRQRESLIRVKNMLLVPIKEKRESGMEEEALMLEATCQKTIESLKEDIKAIEERIMDIIEKEEELKTNYELIRSVPGIGFVTSLDILVYTNNFKRFASAKRLACYAGIAPFGYKSGTSIRGRSKVSSMGNKTLKTSLHMCSLSAIRNNKHIKEYYQKKVEAGKNKMSVINAIGNKLVSRVFACLRDKKKYDANYEYSYKKIA